MGCFIKELAQYSPESLEILHQVKEILVSDKQALKSWDLSWSLIFIINGKANHWLAQGQVNDRTIEAETTQKSGSKR